MIYLSPDIKNIFGKTPEKAWTALIKEAESCQLLALSLYL
jgi:hypothetical protein